MGFKSIRIVINYTLMFCFLSAFNAHAKVASIESLRKWNSFKNRNELIVVLIGKRGKLQRVDSVERDKLRLLYDNFVRSSSKVVHTDARVQFVRLELSENDFSQFSRTYHVSSTPALLLFKASKLAGNEAILYGYPTRTTMDSFIDEWLGVQIDQLVQEEREHREREREDRENSAVYLAPYYGSYYAPYDYWDWPYYGPRYRWGGGYGYYGGISFYGRGHHRHR